MRATLSTLALSALALTTALAGPAAIACDMHGSADNFFLAYIDFRDMTEAEQRAAEQRAIDQFHAQQLETAKARFTRRFTPDPMPEPDRSAVSSPQAL
ncbi:hypothetical protein PK98_09650 [Croceibacterium mercuriale]|uniref:Lipoprotein n=1 Tax=Croceibacterium mercuriale TaxID=1572751 RepID=A0A0B2BSE9_9SPHN|nr:hypothetical protein [Croceibacterium mercuriale]KHL24344.1 hypothetical protein PK98_09650 [Croceibacterium mercuriale]